MKKFMNLKKNEGYKDEFGGRKGKENGAIIIHYQNKINIINIS